MALELRTVETEPFEWVWDKDPEVRAMVRPATRKIERAAAKSSGLEMGVDGASKVWQQAEHIIILAHALLVSLEGITEPGGAPLAITRDNVEWVFNQEADIVISIVDAAREKYAEIMEVSGKSKTQPNGVGGESTAEDVRSPVSTSLPVALADAS
jgi:hypothetical protein